MLAAGLATQREGRRFHGRALEPTEKQMVEQSLNLWAELDPDPAVGELRQLLSQGRLLAMSPASFKRKQERITLGYTDEHGRVLLNPNICFAQLRTLADARPEQLKADLVKTMATLHHEYQHLTRHAGESEAYASEWRFLARCRSRCRDAELLLELADYEAEMSERMRLYANTPPASPRP